jgi:hypothetical protein
MELSWEWYPALFATGLVAGWVDAIAGGGGLLTVPMLLATGMDPQDALGTNKFQSSMGTTMATVQYARHGLLKWSEVSQGVVATASGALLGAACITRINPQVLRPVIPVLLVAIALYLGLKPDLGREARPSTLTGLLLRGRSLGWGGGWRRESVEGLEGAGRSGKERRRMVGRGKNARRKYVASRIRAFTQGLLACQHCFGALFDVPIRPSRPG